MAPPFAINGFHIIIELVSTIIIASLSLIIFLKTKEIQNLSNKNSVKFFRYSFLFFGLAYISRFLLLSTRITIKLAELGRHLQNMNMLIFTPFVIFFSFVAISFLASSVIKKIQDKKNIFPIIIFSSLVISVISLLSDAIFILIIIQLILFMVIFILLRKQHKHRKRKSKITIIYFLLFFGWIVSMFNPDVFRMKLAHELVILPHILSIIIFSIILKKIIKWVK